MYTYRTSTCICTVIHAHTLIAHLRVYVHTCTHIVHVHVYVYNCMYITTHTCIHVHVHSTCVIPPHVDIIKVSKQ